VPPANGTRLDDIRQLEEKMDGQHLRTGNRQDRFEQRLEDFRNTYVSKELLTLHLANVTAVSQRCERALNWIVGFIVASFLGALARIVYTASK